MSSGVTGEPEFLKRAGELGELIRRKDWSRTPLGPIAQWPAYLRISVCTVLGGGLPMVLLCGEQGTLIYNAAYAAFAGARHPEILGMSAMEAWPEVADFNAHVIRTVLAGETLTYHEINMVLQRSGEPEDLWLSIDYSPVCDESGEPRLALAVVRDVTDRVETAQRLAIAQRAGGVGLFEWYPETGQLEASEQYRRIWGLPDGEPVEEGRLLALMHPDDRGAAGPSRRNWSNPLHYAEFRRLDPATGEVRWLARRGEVLQRTDGSKRYLGVVFDITDRKLSEQAFASSEMRWRELFGQMREGFAIGEAIRDAHGQVTDIRFIELNPAFEAQTGLSVNDTLGRSMRDLNPDVSGDTIARYAAVLDSGQAAQFEVQARRLGERWFEVRVRAIGDDRFVALFMDITARHEAEQAIRDSEESLRSIAQSMPNLVWTARPDGQVEWFNDRAYIYSGARLNSLEGSGWQALIHPDEMARVASAWRLALEHADVYETECRLRRADGAYRWHLVRGVPLRDGFGAVKQWIGTNTDIEDRKAAEAALTHLTATLEERVARRSAELYRTQDALRQAQKMEAIGNLTGGIAHDFNNLLQVISGNLQLLEREAGEDERITTRIRNAMSGVARGSRLAQQLLAFGRRQPLAPKVVHLGKLLRDTHEMLRRTLGEGVDVVTVVADGLWNTEVDPGNVENALLNLAINARDAMNGLGRLTIEAGNAVLDQAHALAQGDAAAGEYVVLAISDTGCGMSPEVIEKVFEPFFTTKPEGRGTGLGLSMVYGFVKQSGGHVKIASTPGQGSTIRLYLPRCKRPEDAPTAPPDTGPVVGGTETVLVVEDDDAVRDTVIAMLRDLGYRVLKARHAASALAIIEGGARIDLLFTDVVMPGPMRSVELVAAARLLLPQLAVLFTSGYTQNAIMDGGRLSEGIELLSKPYTREALARRLRQMLGGPGQPIRAAKPVAPAPRKLHQAARPLHILVCEDDWMIRSLIAEMLQARGHRVSEAADAGEAIALQATQPADVLLTDVGLPDMSGVELARRLREAAPELPVLFATGEVHVRGVSPDERTRILTKPFGSDDVRDALDALFSAQAARNA
ncbi:PAS domain S-box protein [Dyella sp.]|jgi:PAS domain S-box-containing protein|uniref:hybrid sensor histidine kinase/response regulator n=1 Tax=Dyella sp. TaxID=1869338 RepID=UPI002D7A356C|nr:PAS domain S-box protein [Dyella sp.]HET6431358.1 PAS domain S-box protein [Dyella sp.]